MNLRKLLPTVILPLVLASTAPAGEGKKDEKGDFVFYQLVNAPNLSDPGRNNVETSFLYADKERGFRIGANSLASDIFSDSTATALLEGHFDLGRRKSRLSVFGGRDEEGNSGAEAKYKTCLVDDCDASLLLGAGAAEGEKPYSYGTLKFGDSLRNGFRMSYADVPEGDFANASAWTVMNERNYFGIELDSREKMLLWLWKRSADGKKAWRTFLDYSSASDSLFTKTTLLSGSPSFDNWYSLGHVDVAFFRDHDAFEGSSPLLLNGGINANQYRPPVSESWRAVPGKRGYGLMLTTLNTPRRDEYNLKPFFPLGGKHYLEIGPRIVIANQIGADSSSHSTLLGVNVGYAYNGGKLKIYAGITPMEDSTSATFQLSLGR
ncbi:MAG: hypothetical protein HYW25_03815 [Candidatus Aenigmarchaeota archaeon]|nr:hypothetical protein [Candidatus Aenigmarchaeota archaeon]